MKRGWTERLFAEEQVDCGRLLQCNFHSRNNGGHRTSCYGCGELWHKNYFYALRWRENLRQCLLWSYLEITATTVGKKPLRCNSSRDACSLLSQLFNREVLNAASILTIKMLTTGRPERVNEELETIFIIRKGRVKQHHLYKTPIQLPRSVTSPSCAHWNYVYDDRTRVVRIFSLLLVLCSAFLSAAACFLLDGSCRHNWAVVRRRNNTSLDDEW